MSAVAQCLRSTFIECLHFSGVAAYACASIPLFLSLFYLAHFFLCFSPQWVLSSLISELDAGDQMYHDDQITLKRQRWSCVVENLTLWRFNSSACSTSAIWRGCLQLHVMATLLDITILPVPAEHVLLALHLLLVIRSQVCKTGLETLF